MEEDQKVIARKWLSWKWILPLVIIVLLLVAAVSYYVLPSVLFPLRRDSVPADAYTVPWMRPNPTIGELARIPIDSPPWQIDSVMTDALKLNMTFRIVIPNGTRIVPSTVYLSHDSQLLYIGGKFQGMFTNPASDPLVEIVPNIMDVFFDVSNDGVLKAPESGSRLSVFIAPDADWYTGKMWGYHDLVWLNYVPAYDRASWILADYHYEWILHVAQPSFSIENVALEYDKANGTLIILFSRYLWRSGNSEVNALQMKPGERWVMGFLVELGYATHISAFGDYVDGWPEKIYPYLSNDSSWWPKLVIDLANPPESFVGRSLLLFECFRVCDAASRRRIALLLLLMLSVLGMVHQR